MTHKITGRLCGYICPNVEEPLENVTLRVYRPPEDPDLRLELATAQPNETARVIDGKELDRKSNRLLLETTTEADGSYEIDFAEVEGYDGGPIELDVYLETVPGKTVPNPDPVQITVTVLNPEWRTPQEESHYEFDYCFSRRFWCDVREQFGAWVVCGRAWDCEDQEARAGLTVRARDADLVQHEVLGSAVTDSDGHFRIYFTRADFERTPPPFGLIELFGGPDLYFEVDDARGNALLREDTSRGRQSDREDAGTCTHVELCLDLPQVPDDGEHVDPIPQFTHVGRYEIGTEITSSGYAQPGGDTLAFTGTLPLIGVMPHGGATTDMEYRFQIENLDTGAVTTLDSSAIRPARIGSLQYWAETSPGTYTLEHDPYYVNNSGAANNVSVGTNGWIQVPTEDDPGSPGSPGTGSFVRDTGLLTRFNSRTVLQEAFDLTSPDVHEAGDGLDASEKSSEHAFAITFESREVGAPGTVRTDTLSRIVISNTRYDQRRHPSWAVDETTLPGVVMLDIEEFMNAGNGCIRLDDTVTAAVTAYNPHINDVTVEIEGPGSVSSPQHPTPSGGEVATTLPFNTSSLQPCAYILWLHVSYDLTRGYGRIDDDHDRVGFCLSDDA